LGVNDLFGIVNVALIALWVLYFKFSYRWQDGSTITGTGGFLIK